MFKYTELLRNRINDLRGLSIKFKQFLLSQLTLEDLTFRLDYQDIVDRE
jgi:hypothetical protein